MKKLLYLLLVLPFAMMISSCSDDNDLPNVDVTISFDKAALKDGAIYAVEENGLQITGITTKTVDSDKASTLVNTFFYWNTLPVPALTFGNFPLEINFAELPFVENAKNELSLNGKLLEVDKSMANFYLYIPVVVVDSEENLPEGLTLGPVSLTYRTAEKDN